MLKAQQKWNNFLGESVDLATREKIEAINSTTTRDIMAQLLENQWNEVKGSKIYSDREFNDSLGAGTLYSESTVNALYENPETLQQLYKSDELTESKEYSRVQVAPYNPKLMTEATVDGDHGYTASNIASGTTTGAVTDAGPAVMGMARRAIPKMIPIDGVCGVQPMQRSTTQVFTLRMVYGSDPLASDAVEAFHPTSPADANFAGADAGSTIASLPATGTDTTASTIYKVQIQADDATVEVPYYTYFYCTVAGDTGLATAGEATVAEYQALLKNDTSVLTNLTATLVEFDQGMATSVAELQEGFNGSSDNAWHEMSFRIDKAAAEARAWQLKAQYSIQLAQDLKANMGLSADSIVQNLLSDEISLEQNRSIINAINGQAILGRNGLTTTATTGIFDMGDVEDTHSARWGGESRIELLRAIDLEANEIARLTGRGRGNVVIASMNVVSTLAAIESNIGPARTGAQTGLNLDVNKSLFAGTFAGYRIFIDKYAVTDYFTVGYKGASPLDCGVVWCPYIPLTLLRGADSSNFQPVLGFSTRAAIVANPLKDNTKLPYGDGSRIVSNDLNNTFGDNVYYRRVFVKNL